MVKYYWEFVMAYGHASIFSFIYVYNIQPMIWLYVDSIFYIALRLDALMWLEITILIYNVFILQGMDMLGALSIRRVVSILNMAVLSRFLLIITL